RIRPHVGEAHSGGISGDVETRAFPSGGRFGAGLPGASDFGREVPFEHPPPALRAVVPQLDAGEEAVAPLFVDRGSLNRDRGRTDYFIARHLFDAEILEYPAGHGLPVLRKLLVGYPERN